MRIALLGTFGVILPSYTEKYLGLGDCSCFDRARLDFSLGRALLSQSGLVGW